MKRGKKIIFSLLIMFLLAACGGVAKEYMEKYDLGMRFLNEGNYLIYNRFNGGCVRNFVYFYMVSVHTPL